MHLHSTIPCWVEISELNLNKLLKVSSIEWSCGCVALKYRELALFINIGEIMLWSEEAHSASA